MGNFEETLEKHVSAELDDTDTCREAKSQELQTKEDLRPGWTKARWVGFSKKDLEGTFWKKTE